MTTSADATIENKIASATTMADTIYDSYYHDINQPK